VAESGAQGELRIGVTGHRVLAEVPRVLAGVEEALDRIEAAFPGRELVVVSCLAEGADRLVAEAVLRRPGARLVVVLPMAHSDCLADFATPESRVEFLALLARAAEVVELSPRATRDEAYAAANDRMLDGVDVLVAVWDGADAQGQGGTAEVVARARARHLPLAWAHAGNRVPGTMKATSLGADQGGVTYENLWQRVAVPQEGPNR
jgi:hypothetical protein